MRSIRQHDPAEEQQQIMVESRGSTRGRAKLTRRVRAFVVVPATVALILAGTAAAASATTGTPSGSPPAANNVDVWCVSTTGAKACFAAYGDLVWVKDTKANGQSAAGTIQGHNWSRQCFN